MFGHNHYVKTHTVLASIKGNAKKYVYVNVEFPTLSICMLLYMYYRQHTHVYIHIIIHNIVIYRFYLCCCICLGFFGGHWTESIIAISQPIVFFPCFILFLLFFFCQLMSQLTTGAGEGRGAIHDSFHRAVTHSRRVRCWKSRN